LSILISAKNISKTYPNTGNARNRMRSLINLLFKKELKGGFEVLSNIDLTVKKGESLAIIGKNGAGKSTLLKIISGVIKPTLGHVKVSGKIGALLELGSGFHLEYTGRENLKMASALAGIKDKNIDKVIDKMIEFADIGKYIDEPVKNYSSGMVVRLGFSVVTVTKPELLITDEVLAVGDTDFQRKCIAWIDTYLKEGGTLLLVSHSIYHVQKLCKNAIWLENGKIKKQGDSFTVSQEYQSFYEKKVDNEVIRGDKDMSNYHIYKINLYNYKGDEIKTIETNEDLVVKVVVYSPDNRPPGIAIGIMRKEMPVFGTISQDHNPTPRKIKEYFFEFKITYKKLKLLPADYRIRVFAMDPECLRIMDKEVKEVRVFSKTTDMGVVELETVWD